MSKGNRPGKYPPKYHARSWAELKRRNGYALTPEDKWILGLDRPARKEADDGGV